MRARVSPAQVEGDATWLRGMVGYQMMIPDYRFTTSVGIDWQDNRLSPEDADNPVSGTRTGFVIQADLETVEPKPIYVGLIGQYSTANRWYWTGVDEENGEVIGNIGGTGNTPYGGVNIYTVF